MNERDKLIVTIERAKRQSEENGLYCILVPFKETDMILKFLKEQDNCENCAIAIEDRQLVVRCKDCKYGYMLPNSSDYVYCTKPYSGTTSHKPDWFCADGERRDGDG